MRRTRHLLGTLLAMVALMIGACAGDANTAEPVPTADADAAGDDAAPGDAGSDAGAADAGAQQPADSPDSTAAQMTGETLRLADTGVGGPIESLDPHNWQVGVDLTRATALFETLTIITGDGELTGLLAESMTPNAEATVWTIILREATWHDGTPVTSADVLYTFERIQLNFLRGFIEVGNIDLANTVAVDDRTVEVALYRPQANFDLFMTTTSTSIVKDGTQDFSAPVGTGPFKLESFTAGDRSVMSRYDGYWGDNALVDTLEILSIGDPTAAVNALLSGEVDIAAVPSPQVAQVQAAGFDTSTADIGSAAVFYMRQDTPPFDNQAVRRALRLAIDRESCVTVGLGGQGEVANDIIGPIVAASSGSSLPQRTYEPDEARRILDEAGIVDLTVELVTANVGQGALECALAFSQHAAQAGIEITVREVDPAELYNVETTYLAVPFGTSQWGGIPFELQVRMGLMSNSFFNETAEYSLDEMILAAEATLDRAARAEAYDAIERRLWESGGFIVWGTQTATVGMAPHVHDPYDVLGDGASPSSLGWGMQYIGVDG